MLFKNPFPKGVYLDCNASMPLPKEVKTALAEAIATESFILNPSSIHGPGQKAKRIVHECKEHLTEMLGTRDTDEWIFLSGATEATNTVLRTHQGNRIAFSSVDHSSVYETALHAPFKERILLKVDHEGQLLRSSVEALLQADKSEPLLLVWQVANNETGAVFDLAVLEEIWRAWRSKEQKLFVLLDAAQAFCKMPEEFLRRAMHFADYLVLSAHKIGGPSGVGALWIRSGAPFQPYVTGGTQEKRRRGGTHNLLGILGFKFALELWRREGEQIRAHMRSLREFLVEEFRKIDGLVIHAQSEDLNWTGLPNTINFHVEGCTDESLLLALDLERFYMSSGSACNSGSLKPSRVLLEMGYSETVALSSLRVCVGPETRRDEVALMTERLAHRVHHIVESRRRLSETLPAMRLHT